MLFSRLHSWLILVESDYSLLNSNVSSRDLLNEEDPVYRALEPLNIPVDSQVFVARIEPGNVILQDVYKIRDELPLILTPRREWSLRNRFPLGPRRDNYGGITFRSATVVSISLISLLLFSIMHISYQ